MQVAFDFPRGHHAPFSTTALFIRQNVMSSVTSTALSCASALSTAPNWRDALREVAATARESLGSPPDLAFIFLSPHHASSAAEISAEACQSLGTGNLLGCTVEA